MNSIKHLWGKIEKLISIKCPTENCKGRLKIKMLDMQFDKLVYECNVCKKEFI